jgi:hypothetical protein
MRTTPLAILLFSHLYRSFQKSVGVGSRPRALPNKQKDPGDIEG